MKRLIITAMIFCIGFCDLASYNTIPLVSREVHISCTKGITLCRRGDALGFRVGVDEH